MTASSAFSRNILALAFFVSIVLVLAVLAALPFVSGAGATDAPAAGNYVVVYDNGVVDPAAATDRREANQGFTAKFDYSAAVKGFAAALTGDQVAALEADPRVAFIQPDLPVNAVGYTSMVAGDTMPPGIRRIEAGRTAPSNQVHQISNVNVAVLDTGINLKHPDLNVGAGKNCISNAAPDDDHGHGSHVAGTIGAKNNGSGIEGVAPGTRVHPVKVLNNKGSGTISSIVCGLDWVAQNAATLNIKVANMSLGGSGSNDDNCGNTNSDAEHQAVCRLVAAGVSLVAAAGNGDANGNGIGFGNFTPAAYPEVLTVTAIADSDGRSGGLGGAPSCRTTERDDKPALFSNFATSPALEAHTIAGPGVCVYSTYKKSGGWFSTKYNTYATFSGTSQATPHIAGSVALCVGNGGLPGPCAGMTPAEIVQKMRGDAQARTTAAPTYGFTGDPTHTPVAGKYYGFLTWDGGY